MDASFGNPRRGHGSDVVLAGALASGATYSVAAARAGVSERTVGRRLQDPEFQATVSRLRSETVRGVAEGLTAIANHAVATLEELLDAPAPPGVRLSAARTILQNVARYHDAAEIDARLQDLERRVDLDIVSERSA